MFSGGTSEGDAVARLIAGVASGDVRSLARALSLVEDGAAEAPAVLEACRRAVEAKKTRARRIGMTGPPGAGKSTLVDGLARAMRGQGRRVGIVAVDPSSAFTGGAVLGDRIRMGESGGDDGIFMRSMATRGHLGGLAAATEDVLTVMEAAGKDVLLIETTGVGQGEIEVVGLADVVAVVLVPGMGDAIQSLKAGVLEIASVYVLNKADREGIERLEQEMQGMLGLAAAVSTDGHGKLRPIVKTVATMGEGVAELLGVLDSLASARRVAGDGGRRGPKGRAGAGVGMVLDHLGIAVRSIDEAKGFYRALGLEVSGVEEIAAERVRVGMLGLGESRIELLEATEAESAIGRYLARRGEGLHHIAVRVPDLAAAVERLKAQGVALVTDAIQIGAGGHRYVFVHPRSAHGVLLELVEGTH
jgi:LAO/AO transport system kinase